MPSFFVDQTDALFCAYGLGFLLVAVVALALHRVEPGGRGWGWLAGFGLLHGTNEWLDMLAILMGNQPLLAALRLGLLTLSFVVLVEYGRRAARGTGLAVPGPWLAAALLAGVALYGLTTRDADAANSAARYLLCLTGGGLASVALWRQAARNSPRWLLRLAALLVGAYALAAGLVVPRYPLLLAEVVNYESFAAFAGFPIQGARLALTWLLALCLAVYCWRRQRQVWEPYCPRPGLWHVPALPLCLAVFCAGGWWLTGVCGRLGLAHDERVFAPEMTQAVVTFAAQAAAVEQVVRTLAGSPLLRDFPDAPTATHIATFNGLLDRYRPVMPDAVLYILDRHGTTLAATNRDTPTSFVGMNYAVRPYFRQALAGGQGAFVAFGLTSRVPGYYTSYPVRDAGGAVVAVVTIKLNLGPRVFSAAGEAESFLLDRHGVVLAATHGNRLRRPLWPLSARECQRVKESGVLPTNCGAPVLPQIPEPGTVIRGGDRPRLYLQRHCRTPGFMFAMLAPVDGQHAGRSIGILVAIIVCLTAMLSLAGLGIQREGRLALDRAGQSVKRAFEHVNDAIAVHDSNGNILEANACFLAMFRLTREAALKSSLAQHIFVPAGTDLTMLMELWRLTLLGSADALALRACRPTDGTQFDVDMSLNRIDWFGTPAIVVALRDITERKQAERALQESEETYHTLVDNLAVGVFRTTCGPQGHFLSANAALATMHGYVWMDEFLKCRVADLYADPAERTRFIEDLMVTGTVRNRMARFRRRDGSIFRASCTARVRRDGSGQPQWIDGILEEVSVPQPPAAPRPAASPAAPRVKPNIA